MARNRSPWFSLGYLLAIAVIVLLLVLFVLWLAEVRLTLTSSLDSRLKIIGNSPHQGNGTWGARRSGIGVRACGRGGRGGYEHQRDTRHVPRRRELLH